MIVNIKVLRHYFGGETCVLTFVSIWFGAGEKVAREGMATKMVSKRRGRLLSVQGRVLGNKGEKELGRNS